MSSSDSASCATMESDSGQRDAESRTVLVGSNCPAAMRKRTTWRIDQFHLLKKLGSGYASTVYLGTCHQTGYQVAIKMYHKNKLSELNYFQVSREIRIHSSLDHQHIVQLWAAFEDQHGIYLVSEFASKGDVFSDVERRGGQLTEAETVYQVIYPFLTALQYLHSKNIIHRDIKPENLLFTGTGVLKVADFGLSINYEEEHPVTRVGTLDYMAPEVVTCPDKHKPSDNKDMKHLHYTALVDSWAVGVLAYEMIIGRPPFDKGNKKATINEILTGEPFLPPFLSEGAAHFIQYALTKDASKRPSIMQLVEHPWITHHLKQAMPKNRGMLARTDSFVEPRGMGFMRPETEQRSSQALEDVVRHLQVQAVQQSGRLLGQSASMSATDTMRWRDVNFEMMDGEDNFGMPKPKRKSDAHSDARSISRKSHAAAAANMMGQHGARVSSGIRVAPDGSLIMESSSGSFSKPMSRQELMASLQMSVAQLPLRNGSFSNKPPTGPSRGNIPGASAHSDPRMQFNRSTSMSMQQMSAGQQGQHYPPAQQCPPHQVYQQVQAAAPQQHQLLRSMSNVSRFGTAPNTPSRMGQPAVDQAAPTPSYASSSSSSTAMLDLQSDLSKLRTGSDTQITTPVGKVYRPQPPSSPRSQELRISKGGAQPLMPSRLSTSFSVRTAAPGMGAFVSTPMPASPNALARQASMRTADNAAASKSPDSDDPMCHEEMEDEDDEMEDVTHGTINIVSKEPEVKMQPPAGIMDAITKLFG